jgi:hypothetical protein
LEQQIEGIVTGTSFLLSNNNNDNDKEESKVEIGGGRLVLMEGCF